MPDYSKTVIYKIFCNDPTITETYVGHTISFIRRENEHKSRCNNQKSDKHNLQIYQTIRDHGGWENWTMVEIETFSCENEKEARKLVSEFVKKFGSTMNSKIPMRNKREYYEDNRENIDLYRKEYCKTNASVIKEKKNYYLNNAEIFKSKRKQFYLDNIEKIKEKSKQRRINKKVMNSNQTP